MGHHRDVIFILNGGRHGHGTGSATESRALHQSVAQVFIDIFRAMVGDVDILGIEVCQPVDGLFEAVDARAFEWRQHFKREGRRFVPKRLISIESTSKCNITNNVCRTLLLVLRN